MLRRELSDRIDSAFVEDTAAFVEDTAPFAKALLLGDRSGIDYETNTAFKVSGIMHMIAVVVIVITDAFLVIATQPTDSP